jgi:hypothetical protein
MKSFKVNKMSGVLKIGSERYIPHQLHQLPKKFEEIDSMDIIKMKGYVYIHENAIPNSKMVIECLHSNWNLSQKNRR